MADSLVLIDAHVLTDKARELVERAEMAQGALREQWERLDQALQRTRTARRVG
jgi:hypothetical protein